VRGERGAPLGCGEGDHHQLQVTTIVVTHCPELSLAVSWQVGMPASAQFEGWLKTQAQDAPHAGSGTHVEATEASDPPPASTDASGPPSP
jgi:hypothetical protein